jgi:GTP-binding protein HflX
VIDTVGFINNIPTQLIESFKATLEELVYADVLINVIDISDLDYKNKEKVTIETLRMANVSEEKINKMITVYNKIDLSPYNFSSESMNYISAYTGQGIEKFKASLIKY